MFDQAVDTGFASNILFNTIKSSCLLANVSQIIHLVKNSLFTHERADVTLTCVTHGVVFASKAANVSKQMYYLIINQH